MTAFSAFTALDHLAHEVVQALADLFELQIAVLFCLLDLVLRVDSFACQE